MYFLLCIVGMEKGTDSTDGKIIPSFTLTRLNGREVFDDDHHSCGESKRFVND